MTSIYPTNQTVGLLSRDDAARYLERMELSPELLDQPASLELLRSVQLAHMLKVPFESTILHIPEANWSADPETPVRLREGKPVELGEAAFKRIVGQKRGSFCFGTSAVLAALLRRWFRVSETAATMSGTWGKNPEEIGFKWLAATHEVMIVDWERSEGKRYLVDVGYAGDQCPYPIELTDGALGDTISPKNAWKVTYGSLPFTAVPESADASLDQVLPDNTPHWVQWRWQSKTLPVPDVASPNDFTKGYWSPLFAFSLQTTSAHDLSMACFYSCVHPSATFVSMMLCSVVRPDGSNMTLIYKDPMPKDEPDGKKFAKFVKDGEEKWIEMKIGTMKEVLSNEFGFLF